MCWHSLFTCVDFVYGLQFPCAPHTSLDSFIFNNIIISRALSHFTQFRVFYVISHLHTSCQFKIWWWYLLWNKSAEHLTVFDDIARGIHCLSIVVQILFALQISEIICEFESNFNNQITVTECEQIKWKLKCELFKYCWWREAPSSYLFMQKNGKVKLPGSLSNFISVICAKV